MADVVSSPSPKPQNVPDQQVDLKVILQSMSLEEKAGFLAGVDDWNFRGSHRFKIPSIYVADCGHGVTLCGDRSSPATCFPTGISMASTWNVELMEEVGQALGRECLALGVSLLLGPMINLHRIPLNGRSFETFSEDPVLAGRLGGAIVRGIQSQGVGACLKSIVANNQQHQQHTTDVRVDERTLRELYLRAFEIAVEESDPAALMTSYNPLNGVNTGESAWLIKEVVRGDWGYQGMVVSDWRAIESAAVYQSGLDLEMPGPGKFLSREKVLAAVETGVWTEAEVDERVERILRLLLKYGRSPHGATEFANYLDSPENRTLAQRVAEESIVLLKNEGGLLPLSRQRIKRLAVIGPNAAQTRLGGGGSASVTPFVTVSPLEGIRTTAGKGIEVCFEEGCSLTGTMETVREVWRRVATSEAGLRAAFYPSGEVDGEPEAVHEVEEIDASWGWAAPGPDVPRCNYAVRFTGMLVPPATGRYRLGVFGQEGGVRLKLGGETVVDDWVDSDTPHDFEGGYASRYQTVEADWEVNQPVLVELDYGKRAARAAVRLEWERPDQVDPIERAVQLAEASDAVILCLGLSNLFEGGSRDRTDLALPEKQVQLLRRIVTVNPHTVVCLNNGGPLSMPWEPEVPAILEAWYPGQAGGIALARLLFGDVNPSGKLPDTIAHRLTDHPSAANYPGKADRVSYREKLMVGYRHFDSAGIEPHYPFGFGLSYTEFDVSPPTLSSQQLNPGESVKVCVDVSNTGIRPGAETVQLYVRPYRPVISRPEKELRSFSKIQLDPGETQTVTFTLTWRDLAYWDEVTHSWQVQAGKFDVLVGSHSRDVQAVTLQAAPLLRVAV